MLAIDLDSNIDLYLYGIYVPASHAPGALASATLLHSALYHVGLFYTPDMTLTEMMPSPRAMARILV